MICHVISYIITLYRYCFYVDSCKLLYDHSSRSRTHQKSSLATKKIYCLEAQTGSTFEKCTGTGPELGLVGGFNPSEKY